ncbi:hypothetical protein M569_00031, partial [Genlisea aurea]
AMSRKFLRSLTPLLISADFPLRNSILDVLDALAANDLSLLALAKILRELNATCEMEMGGLDYEKVFLAYDKVDVKFFYTMHEEHVLPILAVCIHDMTSEELILRQSASRLLASFIKFLGEILPGAQTLDNQWSKDRIDRTIRNFFFKNMGKAMKKEGAAKK